MRHPASLRIELARCAGKGVECTVAEGSQSSTVRFGSLDYIQETLASSQAPMLESLISGLRDSSVVSVLVKSPTEEQHSSSPGSSILLRCGCKPDRKHHTCNLLAASKADSRAAPDLLSTCWSGRWVHHVHPSS